MSVILSACRNTKQRAIARALKKRAEKQKLKKEAELQELEMSQPEAFTKMWSFEIDREYFCIVLYLASHKDTVDIFCNDDDMIVETNVSSQGCSFAFRFGQAYQAVISCYGNPNVGLQHSLTVDGNFVPEVE